MYPFFLPNIWKLEALHAQNSNNVDNVCIKIVFLSSYFWLLIVFARNCNLEALLCICSGCDTLDFHTSLIFPPVEVQLHRGYHHHQMTTVSCTVQEVWGDSGQVLLGKITWWENMKNIAGLKKKEKAFKVLAHSLWQRRKLETSPFQIVHGGNLY